MHSRTKKRSDPYVWATWIAKLLAGESACVWSAWFRAHHHPARNDVDTDFDLVKWQVDHTALIRRAASDYTAEGYKVFTEWRNQFTLCGRLGTLAGRPDLVAVHGQEGWIVDAKTGLPRGSDRTQVMLYMWALPLVNPAYAGVRFQGRVQYKTRYAIIGHEEVDDLFGTRLTEMLREVCGPVEPTKAPSGKECRCCPLTPEDCLDRVETEVVFAGSTNEF